MSELLEHKGYYGSVEYSAADNCLFGKVIGIRGLISYEGDSVEELKKDFIDGVDSYLSFCEENGEEPEKAYKGKFNVRVSPELHKQLAVYATAHHQSLNATVEQAIQKYVSA
jgi:predicted HicB family RNase H-like nuclease